MNRIRRSFLAATGALLLASQVAVAGGDWNDPGIAWKSYDAGLAEAKQSNKPVLLVFYTDWCPHCTNYSKAFHDPKLVELSRKFVMVRLDNQKNAEIGAKYALDGDYIPRTYFLKPDGTVMPEITEQRAQYKYFYNESDPASVMRSMNAVLEKTR